MNHLPKISTLFSSIFHNSAVCRLFLIILVFLQYFTITNGQNTDLTLDEAIAIARQGNIALEKSELGVTVAENQLKILQAGLRPQLMLNATLPNFYKSTTSVIQPNGSILFQPVSQDNSLLSLQMSQKVLATNTTFFAEANVRRYQDFSDDITQYNSIPFRLGIVQPLNMVNYDRWNRRLYTMDQMIARRHLSATGEKIATEVTAAFFEVLMAQIDRQIATTNKENNERLHEIARERYALGKISKSDLLQLELGLSNAAQNEIRSHRALIRSGARLKEAMNQDLSTDEIPQVATPQIPDLKPIDPEWAAAMAWENRPEHWEYQKLILQAEQAMEIADRENGWQAQLTAQVGFTGSGSTLNNSYGQTNLETLVEVGIHLPILDGGKRKYSMADARSRHDYVTTEAHYSELTFRQNVRQLVLQFNQLQNEAELAFRSYEIAEQRYEIVNQRYVLDDISITDLTLAFGERDQAWRNYISTLQAYWITYYTIRQLTLYDIG